MLVLGSDGAGSIRVRVTNPDAVPAQLDAFDVGGRQLATVHVDPRTDAELALPFGTHHSGIGFVRFRCASSTIHRKVALVR